MKERTNSLLSTYRIFISYTSSDKELASYLTDALRRILGNYNAVHNFARPGTQDSLAGSRPADNFEQNIDTQLKSCNVFILLWSEAARKQNWINYEMTHAKRFLVQKARRMGREFKLIPISIDRCSIPFGLHHLVRASYASGADMQETLNQVLNALALPAEYDDPQVIFVRNICFEVNTAFEREAWPEFLQKHAVLVQSYPGAVSTDMRYKYALALFYSGQMENSFIVANEGLILENREADLALLKRYIELLKEKRRWNEVLALIEKVLVKFPTHADWLQMRWEVVSRMNSSTSSFFLPPNPQVIQQPSQMVNVVANGANGASVQGTENFNTSFIPLQQTSSFFQNSFVPNAPIMTQQLDPHLFAGITNPGSQNNQPNVTRKLSEEELQTEMESSSSSSWQRADTFTEKHISPLKIEKLLEPFVIFVAVINILYIAFVSFLLSPDTSLVAFEAILLLVVLCVGRYVESETIKLACIIMLLTFWAISGYCCGYRLYNQLGWGTQRSLGLCIGIISAIVIVAIGGRFHLQLFYHKKQ